MDLALFSKDSFDVKDWVENILKERPEGDGNIESFVSSASMKLQLLSQDLNSELERGMMDIMSSFPRAMLEVERFEGSTKCLKVGYLLWFLMDMCEEELSLLTGEVDRTRKERHGDPDDPVNILSHLHQLKTNMERCRSTLTEAANWNQLVRDVNAKFASGELSQLADKLQAMKYSLTVLENMPEASERVKTMEQLESQLEVVLKPKLQNAIQKETVTSMHEFTDLYRKLGKLEVLVVEYAKFRPAQIHRYWYAFSDEKFKDWLPSFYKQVSDLLADERRRCHEVFGPELASRALAELVIETFQPLSSSFHHRMGQGTLPFPDVVGLYTETLRFLARECDLISPKLPAAQLLRVTTTTCQPFVDFVRRYEALEGKSVEAWATQSLGATQEILATADQGNPLPAQMEDVLDLCSSGFTFVDHLVDRCIRFTFGYHARELVRLVNKLLSADIGRFTEIFRSVRRQCGLTSSAKSTSAPSTAGGTCVLDSESESPRAMSAPFDWDLLQGCLRLLQAFGRYYRLLGNHEKSLARTLAHMYGMVFEGGEAVGRGVERDLSLRGLGLVWVRSLLDDSPAERSELKSFLRVFNDPVLPGDLFKAPFRSATSYSSEGRRLVFDVCMKVVRERLATVPTLSVWASDGGTSTEFEPNLSYSNYSSNLPQQYITQVGEHILSLFQQLEDFAGSDALAEVTMVMSGLDRLGEEDWREVSTVLGLSEAETSSFFKMVSSGEGVEGWVEIDPSITGAGDPNSADVNRLGGDDSAHFCSEWLSCIAKATTGTLLSQVLQIPHLTRRGAQQVAVDTSYLLNVLGNLEIQPPPLLCMINRIMDLDDDELSKALEERDRATSNKNLPAASALVRKIERRIGSIRGITLAFEAK